MIGIAGFPISGMLAFDQVIIDLMNTYAVPGTAIAVSRNGTIDIERGYGMLDLNDPNSQVTAGNQFRIASVSKPITAMAILKLIEQNGPLTLESFVLELLKDDFPLLPGQTLATGVDQIRIRHLLQHSAGWDDSVYDPMFDVDNIAKEAGMSPPADQRAIIRKMWSKPLVNNPPGSKYAYSNFHYCLLGRVIEHVTGQRYADYVASIMLGPLKMDSTFQGSSFLSGRHAGEARYFPYPGQPQANSVFPPFSLSDAPYGPFDLENMDSHGGWVSSPRDLLSFINGLFRGTLLSSSSLSAITSDSISIDSSGAFYGLGWNFKPIGGGFNFWHVGRLDGSTALLVRTIWSDGSDVSWAALMNMRDGGQTGGPAAVGAPSISIFGNQQHIAYLDGNGAVQDAWYDGTKTWNLQQINLIGVTAGLPAAGDPFVSVFGQQQHFAYRDSSGTIQDAWYDSGSNTWSLQQINMGAETKGPPAVGNPFVSVLGEQQHFVYRDAAGAIQDAWYDSGSNSWSLQQINLGGVTAGASAAGDPSVSVFGDQQHFVYRDTAGTIRDAWYDAGSNSWSLQQINLGGVTNAPAAAGEPCTSVFGQQQHFIYRDSFGVVWDSWYDGGSNRWNLQQINGSGVTEGPLAAADPGALVIGQQQHFAYRDENGVIWDAWYDGASNAWDLQQINSAGGVTNGPLASSGPVLWTVDGQEHFTYVDANGTVFDSWFDGASDNWNLQQINRHGISLSDALDAAIWSALKALPSLP